MRVAYSLPALGLAVVGIPIYVYLPKFYTDVVGVPAAVAGTVLLTVRVFDALSDPACGWLSDRTRTAYGRRKPYLALGSVPLAAVLYGLFSPPPLEGNAATAWFAAGLFLVFLFWTVVEVPYEALGPEITFDYDERIRVLGMRDGFVILGTFAAVVFPVVVSRLFHLPPGSEGEREKFFLMALVYAPFLVLACLACIAWVPETSRTTEGNRSNLWEDIRYAWKNRPFRILLAAYTLSAFGSNLPATLILYYVQYVLESSRADLFLALYFVTGILFLPVWIGAARRFGKKPAWLTAMGVNTGAFAAVFFLGPGDERLYALLVVLSGVGFGGAFALPAAMQADVIDYHEWMTGARREGHYIGIWSIAKKLAAALGVGLALWVIGESGYVPNAAQAERVVLALRVLYALVPSLCNALALVVALGYPIDRQAHRALREAVLLRGSQGVEPS